MSSNESTVLNESTAPKATNGSKKWLILVLGAATAVVLFFITKVQNWDWLCLFVLVVALIGTAQDAKNISWEKFLPTGFLVLGILFLIYKYSGGLWNSVVVWQTESIHHIFQWNQIFNAIPLNDGAIFRVWQPKALNWYFTWVYNNGFALSYWICIIRSFFTKDVKKIATFALAGYLLQVPFVLVFYNTVLLQEVWYVQGVPDLLHRVLTPAQQFSTTLNCFPSLHTSIAFSGFLLAMREKSKWFRWWVGIYSISILVATLYLKIHWVLDVFAGMLFAYGCVKLADWIVNAGVFPYISRKFTGTIRKIRKNS
ncbi:phosphatase PAP2 family protein [Paenibacillus psychroresistens]|uniref:Phosphatase PAP2 family protein n=1 Tax=Paenibacillus psychroresistens TaxID=1778678 RepID=A0A6B8RJ39_9BACL|nr:phosphatase PAP2 family protein [Paenibacillus psychroresistens]QGQ95338.1 phosphatase PAP2 family protein [Paenibacillus psychroresistens]